MRPVQRTVRRARSGFTLLELMVAIAVLLVAVMAAFSSQLTAMSLVSSSRDTNAAMSDLQACMEQLLTRQLDGIPIAGSDYEAGQPVAAYDALNLQGEQIVPTYPGYVAGNPVPDPLPIVLRCTWNDSGGRPRFLKLRSMKVR